MSKLTEDKKTESLKLRTEIKGLIDRMAAAGTKLTKAEVCRQAKCSRSFMNTLEMTEYLEKAQAKQDAEDLRVDIELQNTNLYRKLMASYIFQYALLDEQEAFLKEAIAELKEKTNK